MRIKILIGLLSLCILNGCAQKKSKVDMNTMIEETFKTTPKHDKQPLYGIQIDKMGCRLSIAINDETLVDYFEKGGFSATETINGHIIKSGNQTLKVMVYPRNGAQFIDDLAHIKLELFYVAQKGDPMDSYKIMKTIELPKDLKEKKLSYFEINIPFEANVPWDFSAFYNNLVDLRKVPEIEKKVIAEYEKIRGLISSNDSNEYLKFILKNQKMEYEAFYMTKDEVNESVNWLIKDATPLENKEVLPMKNYELVFEKEGKKVFLRDRTSRDGAIRIEYGTINTEGDYKGQKSKETSLSPNLILVKGKTEFESL
ncbi:hypothetical protein [Pedobacter jamesrossensis]|uniref:Lipoprotein n=1 Tax=Pedobacter jamesrossensis TaxID=1908238 RepID=A0ABV8NQR1_9SPHI